MMFEEHTRTSNLRTPTGRGTLIEIELPLRSHLNKRPISKVTFLVAPTSPKDPAQGFKLTRTVHYDDRPAPTKQTLGNTFPTPEAALNEIRVWLMSSVGPREQAPNKRSLIEAGRYFEGGRGGHSLRKVIAVTGSGMVHWCDFAGLGSCLEASFASWMKRRTDTPDPKEAKRVEEALERSGVSMGSMQLAATFASQMDYGNGGDVDEPPGPRSP